jgi:hypothetical protein
MPCPASSGCIVVFMLTAGSYLTPILLGGKNSSWFTEQIYDQFITRYNWESGAAFGFLLLAFTSLVVWGGLKLSGQTLNSHGGAKLMAIKPNTAFLPATGSMLACSLCFWQRRWLPPAFLPSMIRCSRRCHGRASRSTGSSTTPSRNSACSTTGGCCAGSTTPS